MHLQPFVRVDGVDFTITRAALRAMRGAPLHCGRNEVGLNELDYGSVVFRFQDNGRLEEVTQQAPVVHLDKVAVPFAALRPFVAAHDPQVFERAGFVVSPAFGIAFDPACPTWVTALARHCIDSWRAL